MCFCKSEVAEQAVAISDGRWSFYCTVMLPDIAAPWMEQ